MSNQQPMTSIPANLDRDVDLLLMEAANEIESLRRKTIRQRIELRRLNKTLRSIWEGVRFYGHVTTVMRAKQDDVSDNSKEKST